MPRSFREIYPEKDPEGFEAMMKLRSFACQDGALPPKTKTLLAIFADLILGHPGGAKAILKANANLGITQDEIKELVRMAALFGGMPVFVMGAELLED